MDDIQRTRLDTVANQGQIIRNFCQHEGFKIYIKALEDLKAKKEKLWLQGTEQEAREARLHAQGIELAISELKKFVLSGDSASKILREEAENDLVTPRRSVDK